MELNIEYTSRTVLKDAQAVFKDCFGNLKLPGIVKGTAESFIRQYSR